MLMMKMIMIMSVLEMERLLLKIDDNNTFTHTQSDSATHQNRL